MRARPCGEEEAWRMIAATPERQLRAAGDEPDRYRAAGLGCGGRPTSPRPPPRCRADAAGPGWPGARQRGDGPGSGAGPDPPPGPGSVAKLAGALGLDAARLQALARTAAEPAR